MAIAMSVSAGATTPTATATGKALILLPLKLTKVDDLSFGTVVSSSVAGTVTINASNGARSHAGGVLEVSSDAGGRGLFDWAGTPDQKVSFNLSYPATLDDGKGNSVQVSMLYLDSSSATADSTGVVEVGVGGSVLISANQAEGLYKNTFVVTANYQ